jgi:hypothetical protein
MYVKANSPSKIIGTVHEPFSCSHFTLQLKDDKEKDRYRIDASCCQCGIGCRGSIFGKCYQVFFPIFSASNPARDLDGSDGLIHKRHSACSKDDDFVNPEAIEIVFPEKATAEDKFMLICIGLLIDYRYYEENPHEVQSEAKLDG